MLKFIKKIVNKTNNTTYSIRYDILEEEHISYTKETGLLYIHYSQKSIIIPTTQTGLKIIQNTRYFVEDLSTILHYSSHLLYSQKYFLDEILKNYKRLDLNWTEENIAIFNSLKSYKLNTKNNIYNLEKIETLLNILSYPVEKKDIKQLTSEGFDAIPIVFPIRERTEIRSSLNNINNKNLLELIFKNNKAVN